jgi:hypothetical protein
MDLHLMLNVFNEGASEMTRKTSTEENWTLTWKTMEKVRGGRIRQSGSQK